jgi:hypothetical protein
LTASIAHSNRDLLLKLKAAYLKSHACSSSPENVAFVKQLDAEIACIGASFGRTDPETMDFDFKK